MYVNPSTCPLIDLPLYDKHLPWRYTFGSSLVQPNPEDPPEVTERGQRAVTIVPLWHFLHPWSKQFREYSLHFPWEGSRAQRGEGTGLPEVTHG